MKRKRVDGLVWVAYEVSVCGAKIVRVHVKEIPAKKRSRKP